MFPLTWPLDCSSLGPGGQSGAPGPHSGEGQRVELPPLWHALSATPGHMAVMETRMAGHRSSLGLEMLAAQA